MQFEQAVDNLDGPLHAGTEATRLDSQQAALEAYAQAVGSLQLATRIDPSWTEPRQALADVRRRALAVPALTPAVEASRRRFESLAGAAGAGAP